MIALRGDVVGVPLNGAVHPSVVLRSYATRVAVLVGTSNSGVDKPALKAEPGSAAYRALQLKNDTYFYRNAVFVLPHATLRSWPQDRLPKTPFLRAPILLLNEMTSLVLPALLALDALEATATQAPTKI